MKDKYNKDSNYYGDYADYASVDSSKKMKSQRILKKQRFVFRYKELNLENKSKLSNNNLIKSISYKIKKLIDWIEI